MQEGATAFADKAGIGMPEVGIFQGEPNAFATGAFKNSALVAVSTGLLQGMTGARYDAVDKVLHLEPRVAGDFRAFLSTATGYGTVGVRAGKPFCWMAFS